MKTLILSLALIFLVTGVLASDLLEGNDFITESWYEFKGDTIFTRSDTTWASQSIEWKYKDIDNVICHKLNDSVVVCDTIWIDLEVSHSEAMWIKDNE